MLPSHMGAPVDKDAHPPAAVPEDQLADAGNTIFNRQRQNNANMCTSNALAWNFRRACQAPMFSGPSQAFHLRKMAQGTSTFQFPGAVATACAAISGFSAQAARASATPTAQMGPSWRNEKEGKKYKHCKRANTASTEVAALAEVSSKATAKRGRMARRNMDGNTLYRPSRNSCHWAAWNSA